MGKPVKRRRLKKNFLRVIYLFIVLFGVLYGSLFLYDGFYHGPAPSETIVHYNINHGIDYKVGIKDNQFGVNENDTTTYITELVDSILTNFTYEFLLSKTGQIVYEYEIKGNLIGEYQGALNIENSEVWNKEYVFVEKTKMTLNDVSALRFNKELLVNYPEINAQVIAFKNEMKMPITAYMDITLTMNVFGYVDGEEIHESSTESLHIPFNQIAFDLKKNVPANRQGSISFETSYEKYNIKKFIMSGICYVIALITFIFKFRIIFNRRKLTKYEAEIEHIMKAYGDVIITLVSPINEEELNVVHVETFNQLIGLEEELRIPINYYEVIEKKLAEFSIIHNSVIYKYVYKNQEEDL